MLKMQNVKNDVSKYLPVGKMINEGYSEWTRFKKEELAIARDNRQSLTMHKALHPKSDVDRLYLPRLEGGRGLQSAQDNIRLR